MRSQVTGPSLEFSAKEPGNPGEPKDGEGDVVN